MNTKVIFLLMVAIGCGTVAAVAGSQMIKNQKVVMPQRATTKIVVAAVDVAVSAQINAEKFKFEEWPVDRVPQGSVTSMKDVEGKYTNQRMYAGEPLLEKKIINSKDSIANTIPEGYKVFDMPIGDSGYIKPGDRVDVFGYFEKSSKITQTRSIRVLENVTVLMVDGIAVRDVEETGKRSAKTAQLLIRDSQYEALTTAANLGKLRLALCGLTTGEDDAATDNGEEFLAWVADSVKGDSGPTSGAPQIPDPMLFAMTTAPVEEEVEKEEEFSMVVYSGGQAQEFRWTKSQFPQPVGGSKQPAKEETPNRAAYSTPPGKFTGENMQWDAVNEDWTQTELKSDSAQADARDETAW